MRFEIYCFIIYSGFCIFPTFSFQPDLMNPEADILVSEAKNLLGSLYSADLGVQKEYLVDTDNVDSKCLAKYERVYTYTQGIALANATLAFQRLKAHKIATWMYENSVKVTLENGKSIWGGWHFSQNTDLSDNWLDVRLVTGASAWALHGLSIYICSDLFADNSKLDQEKFKNFFSQVLTGLSYHQRSDGLITAGWTALELINSRRGDRYYEMLDKIGYNSGGTRIKAENVVTEHNLDMLALWNHAISNAEKLGLKNKEELNQRRDQLRKAIFTKLYDEWESRFVTGTVKNHGVETPSKYSAIDNVSWLSLSVDYQDLNKEQVEKISNGLTFAIEKFGKNIEYDGDVYFGAHYFPNNFSDPYITPNPLQEKAYNLEATAGLVLGLNKFCDANPGLKNNNSFRDIAYRMWCDMERFVRDRGFLYATKRIKYLLTQLQSSTAAVWFLDVHDYYDWKSAEIEQQFINLVESVP